MFSSFLAIKTGFSAKQRVKAENFENLTKLLLDIFLTFFHYKKCYGKLMKLALTWSSGIKPQTKQQR